MSSPCEDIFGMMKMLRHDVGVGLSNTCQQAETFLTPTGELAHPQNEPNSNDYGSATGLLDAALAPFQAVSTLLSNGVRSLGDGISSGLGYVGKTLGLSSSARPRGFWQRLADLLIPQALAAPSPNPQQYDREVAAYRAVKSGARVTAEELQGLRPEISETLLAVQAARDLQKDFEQKLGEVKTAVTAIQAQKATLKQRASAIASHGGPGASVRGAAGRGSPQAVAQAKGAETDQLPSNGNPAANSDLTGTSLRKDAGPSIASLPTDEQKRQRGKLRAVEEASATFSEAIPSSAASREPGSARAEREESVVPRDAIHAFLRESTISDEAAAGESPSGRGPASTGLAEMAEPGDAADLLAAPAGLADENLFQRLHRAYAGFQRSGRVSSR